MAVARSASAVIFNYEPRPDTYTDRRTGAPIASARGTNPDVGSGQARAHFYAFTYEPEHSTGKYSLLIKVEQVGDDGVSKLPPQKLPTPSLTPPARGNCSHHAEPATGRADNPDADLVDINADGLPDVVYTPEDGQHRFYLNRGHGRWQIEPLLPQELAG
ncbi:MAG: VCBS repeat-containing protein [Caldilineaceae bacterium]